MKHFGAIAIAILIAVSAGAQGTNQRGPVPQQDQQTITVLVERVNVPFTVIDKKGKFITDLKQEDFKVYEDGKLQMITAFRNNPDLPLSIVLVMDTSSSVRTQLRFEQDSAIEFFRTVLKRGKDRGALVTFDSDVDVKQGFTDDANALMTAIDQVRVGRYSSLYEGVYLTTTKLLANENGDARRIMLLISDGDDNGVRYSFKEALEVLQKNDVAVYAISTNTSMFSSTQEKGNDVLKKFAEETGGQAFFPSSLEDLAVKFKQVGAELRLQYGIVYRPSNTKLDGKFREIKIEVANKDYKVVRNRPGYMADRAETTPDLVPAR